MPIETGLDAFADVEKLIVVAAHPDDLECMCGGTIWKLAQRGVEIFSANCTLGDIGAQDGETVRPALAATRMAETDAAAERLGIRRTFNLGRHDGELVADLELRAAIAWLYRLTQADTLFTFDPYWPGQIHPDHRAAGQAAIDAYMPSKMPLYRPEQLSGGTGVAQLRRIFVFGTDRQPDIAVDVTDVYQQKIDACKAHTSQFPKGEESLEWLRKRDAAGGEKAGVAYAEIFRTVGVW